MKTSSGSIITYSYRYMMPEDKDIDGNMYLIPEVLV